MFNCSPIQFVKEHAPSLIVGAALGFLGHYVITWFKTPEPPLSTIPLELPLSFPLPCLTVHVMNIVNSKITIRKIRIESSDDRKKIINVKELNDLRVNVKWLRPTQGDWDSIFKTASDILYVKKSSNLIAYACLLRHGKTGILFDMHVHSEHQRQGIGTFMMNYLIKYIQKEDYLTISLSIAQNSPALKFYQKFGFKADADTMKSHVDDLKIQGKA